MNRLGTLVATLSLGGSIAAASAVDASAFVPTASVAPAVSLTISPKEPVIVPDFWYWVRGGDRGSPTAHRELGDAVLDLPVSEVRIPDRVFMLPTDLWVFNPPPPSVFAGGTAPRSTATVDAILDLTPDG
ncbi:MAG TPA: hypothetical protein VK698_17500, partial [Kofleriaceae bacterium]|nr:hypothetical protein [Kofleriaceae bacterium]